ncbi:hypothetical protein J1N35_004843 [Gossypium stocksii]|uniref:Uncharacterized protein n=1 Tax=Gossypium stocksii TaxID=47602 RepID=A0A9D4AIF0_9ROSI|nr:hypothetical protein J1N35_004843 [Gossypium stocksii]
MGTRHESYLGFREKSRLTNGFDFLTEWFTSRGDMCLFKQTIKTDGCKNQLERLCTGNPLVIEDLITMRNVFLHYLVGIAPMDISRMIVEKLLTIIGDVDIVRSSRNDSKKTTSTSREINEAMEISTAMDLRAALRAQPKKRRTDRELLP